MQSTVILVVEDDAAIRRGMVDALRAHGHAPVEAADGAEALAAMEQDAADLILLDVMMPGEDGFTVLGRIRDRWADVPVIMVTARGAESDRVRGLGGGADDYLVKPFGMRELLARVDAVLRRTMERSRAPLTLTLGGVRVDLGRRRIDSGDEAPVGLTDCEASILDVLGRHPERAVSRDELLQRLWGTAGGGVETRTVDIHVSRLRAKVGEGFVETVRGAGYRLGDDVQRAGT